MKLCPNCGAQITDDSRFCSECGKEIPQPNVCPHCGASVGDGDVFCYNCGKSLNESSSEPIDYEEEEQKSGFKKYLHYIIGIFLLLMIIGYWFSNNEVSSSNDKVVETDTTEVISKEKTEGKDFTDVEIKGVVEDMYKEILDGNGSLDFDEKYTSAEYKSLYEKAISLSDGPIIDADHWINSQDCDKASVKNVSVKKLSDNEATANVSIKLFKDFDTISKVKLVLLYEGGKWVVDDFLTDYEGEELSEKNLLKQFIKEAQSMPKNDYSWLQGHWVYEQGSYKGHFIIEGDKITQYSSMNPERETSTFRVEGDEIVSRIANGVNLTVKIDFANQRIDYGDGLWMRKVSSSSDNYSSSGSNTSSSSRTFTNEQMVVGYLANKTFRSSDGFTIRFDGSGRMYAEGDYAGVVSVLNYNSMTALLRYSGGQYSEGRFKVDIVGDKLKLTDPIDGTVYYQK